MKKRSISRTLSTALGASLLTLLTACTENKDLQAQEVPLPPVTGHVSIAPQWGTATNATPLRYCFYPIADAPGEAIYAEGTTNGFEGELPAGTYRMLAYNAHVQGASFVGVDRWQTAAVQPTAATTRGSYNLVNQMPHVFATNTQETIAITAGQTHTHTANVRKLTRTFDFAFSTDGTLRVKHLTGTLCGVYPVLLLATDQPTPTATQAAPHTAVRFEMEGWATGEQKTQVSVPGLLDPQNGTCYDNRLTLQVDTHGGEQWHTTVDLNSTLTRIFNTNAGHLPVEVPIEISVGITHTPVGIAATVRGWQAGETSEGVIH